MDDLVYRQDVIDSFDCSIGGVPFDSVQYVSMYADKMIARVKNLPSAHPQYDDEWRKKHYEASYSQGYIDGYKMCEKKLPRWIPCSERLPEQYGNYLISIHGEDEPDIGTINPNDKRGWSLCDANGFHWASDKKLIVTAWMPLPEPYKGGD